MPTEEVKRVAELIRRLHQATSVQEVLELSSQLEMDFTEEEAKEYLNLITPVNVSC
jgi:hypothetical protein